MTTIYAQLKPVGQRPRCLACDRELKPNLRRERPPLNVPTGQTIQVRTSRSYGTAVPEYEETLEYRPLTAAERRAWVKAHPAEFLGTYGGYQDNRFCGLNCGYVWAVRNSKEAR